MDPQVGFTTPNLAEAATNQALAQSAAATVVTADSSKWGVQALAQIVPLDQAQHLITDTSLPDRAAAQARRHLAQLTLVEPETVNLPRS
jgi:DeoR family glycerol-3-phosphate regulon repressor